MVSSVNFRGTYQVNPTKASPLCKIAAAADVLQCVKNNKGTVNFIPSENILDALQQPFICKVGTHKGEEELEEVLEKAKNIGITFDKQA